MEKTNSNLISSTSSVKPGSDSAGQPITDERVDTFMGKAQDVQLILQTLGNLLHPGCACGRALEVDDDDIDGLACLLVMLSEQLTDVKELA